MHFLNHINFQSHIFLVLSEFMYDKIQLIFKCPSHNQYFLLGIFTI